jgi:hypothetical protein
VWSQNNGFYHFDIQELLEGFVWGPFLPLAFVSDYLTSSDSFAIYFVQF